MKKLDLLSLRQEFSHKNILLCFNGPISSSLIQELGEALKNYLHADQTEPTLSMDVFGVYIELTQNIRHYAQSRGYDELLSSATVVVGRGEAGGYQVLAGNIVEPSDGQAMRERINELAQMDKVSLKQLYKKQLRAPRTNDAASGAGLGLIDVCRKASEPITCELVDTGDGRAFLSILASV